MRILVTGAAGYIGSHTVLQLVQAGHSVVGLDNLSNGSPVSIARVEQLTGKSVPLFKIDIRDTEAVRSLLRERKFDCCMHFAGLKSVADSIEKPLVYYENNVLGTILLLKELNVAGCHNFIFSSSATVYGNNGTSPISEKTLKGQCANPYGTSKSMIEDILIDLHRSCPDWNIILLRYFNPVGAHSSGQIGEAPLMHPNNLMPNILNVALGKQEKLFVYGDDYPTPDGTAIRDFIHIEDLAYGHILALDAINKDCGLSIYNLGTGRGYSVLEMVQTFESSTGIHIPYEIVSRRQGDLGEVFAAVEKAETELGFKATHSLEDMCVSAWNWIKRNPNGYLGA